MRSALQTMPVVPAAQSIAGKPWLSVIMPVHRGERWVEAALRSVAEQADAGVELIVLDSSPTDDTLALVRTFEDRLTIRYLEHAGNPMWHAKTNIAAVAARADHLCWLHQDDLWLPGRAAAIRRWIAQDPGAVLHLSASAIIDASGRRRGVWRCPLQAGEVTPERYLRRLLVQNFIAVPAPVIRRDAYLACGGLDESLWYTADWDLWLKLGAMGAVRYDPVATAAFRVHGSSLTVSGSHDRAGFERQMKTVLDRHLPRLDSSSGAVARVSEASIRVNSALAAASGGTWRGLAGAAAALARLGPVGLARYLRDSRIVERVLPRLRARVGGTF